MAAIDPTAPAMPDPENPNAPPRATLKMIRHYDPIEFDDDEDDEDDEDDDDEDIDDEDVAAIERKLGLELGDDEDDDEDEEDSEDEAGPSDPEQVKKARAATAKKLANGVDDDIDMDLPNGINGVKKGKGKAAADFDDDDDEDLDDLDDDEFGDEDDVELPLCTLDTTSHYQQALDLTVMDTSTVSFKVIGTHSIFLTGNFVEVPEDDEGDEHDDDEDEEDFINDLDRLIAPYGEDEDLDIDSEEDELDELDDPRVEELMDEDEPAPKLVKAKATPLKGKNKRPAESEDEENDDLDNLISKTLKSADAAQTNGEQKLSKKQLKKLKKNDGQAATAAAADEKKPAVKDSPASGKKVQFAKELEQGPTPTKTEAKPDAKKESQTKGKGVFTVQGVKVDERKVGSGPGAKKGDKVSMRYIGKTVKDDKVFDC